MATLKDVAKLANVDVSTVSRAIRNAEYVHPETRARVMAAVKKLGYKPNMVVKGLQQGKCSTIGVVVPYLHLTVFDELVQSIESEAELLGYTTMICHTKDDPETERHFLSHLDNGIVDGIIISGTGKNNHFLKNMHENGMPVVQVVREQEKSISSIVCDYKKGCYDAVHYLYKKGCRNIALINGPLAHSPYKRRYDGYIKATKELSIPAVTVVAEKSANNLDFDYWYKCASKLLDENSNLDGILVSIDVQGMAALRVFKERGITVPEKMRVVSLTGDSISRQLETALSVQKLPVKELGSQAVQLLVKEIELAPGNKITRQNIVLNPLFIERESSR